MISDAGAGATGASIVIAAPCSIVSSDRRTAVALPPCGEVVPARIIARLSVRPLVDKWADWSMALWRGAALCFAIMILFAGWTLVAPPVKSPATDLSQDFENAVLAAVDQDQPADASW